jgi:phospholipid/cholesterol/gamma-HCH transport system permease protein
MEPSLSGETAIHTTASNASSIAVTTANEGVLHVRFSGDWLMQEGNIPDMQPLKKNVAGTEQHIKRLLLELDDVGAWDTILVSVLYSLIQCAKQADVEFAWKGAPSGVETLLQMALQTKSPLKKEDGHAAELPEKLGRVVLGAHEATDRVLTFIGEVVLSVGRLIKHKAYFRTTDFAEALTDVGPRALPIVTLISFLVGLILAFVGAMQLRQFGAQVFVANLVGIGMAREMGAMMTGIVMAGRTGASYAARLGTMQVNEEVDALRTNGIDPVDFLTLPRILALTLMMPILAVYSVAVGILGGMTIGVFMLDLSLVEYWYQTMKAVPLNHFWAGLIKSVVFAWVVALAGCYHGLRCGRSSEAVGQATTRAVVSAIIFIIITDSVLTVVYDVIDF